MLNDVEEETDEHPDVNCIKNFFSREERMAMVKKHALDITIKLFGKSVDYRFLLRKLNIMWKTSESFDMMDLGNGFFKVAFQNKEDLDSVLRKVLGLLILVS